MYEPPESKVPIVYDDIYNISFMGLEKLHPFDSCKWGRIIDILEGELGVFQNTSY